MNKKGLLGTIILVIIVLVVLAIAFFYFQLKNNGIQLSSGDLKIDIKYNDSDKGNTITGGAITEINNTGLNEIEESNITEENLTIEQNETN